MLVPQSITTRTNILLAIVKQHYMKFTDYVIESLFIIFLFLNSLTRDNLFSIILL